MHICSRWLWTSAVTICLPIVCLAVHLMRLGDNEEDVKDSAFTLFRCCHVMFLWTMIVLSDKFSSPLPMGLMVILPDKN